MSGLFDHTPFNHIYYKNRSQLYYCETTSQRGIEMPAKNNDKLIDLVIAGKSNQLEFSDENLSEPMIARHIVAMLNAKGGLLLFGIDDDSQIVGIQFADLEHRLMDIAAKMIHPAIFPEYYETSLTDKKIGVLEISAGENKPYYYHWKGKQHYCIRSGKTSRTASANEITTLMKKNGTVRYELAPVVHAHPDDLDVDRLNHFCMTRRRIDLNALSEEERIELLQTLGILVANKKGAIPTIAGLLLFGKAPKSRLSSAGISVNIYNGVDTKTDSLKMECNSALIGIYDEKNREIIKPGIIDDAMEIISDNISEIEGEAAVQPALPLESVREAITNAIVHRDYCITDRQVCVNIFDDRVEVINPGRLYEQVSVEKISLGVRCPRNIMLYNYFSENVNFKTNSPGLFNTILHTTEKFAGKAPLIEELNTEIKVTIFSEKT